MYRIFHLPPAARVVDLSESIEMFTSPDYVVEIHASFRMDP